MTQCNFIVVERIVSWAVGNAVRDADARCLEAYLKGDAMPEVIPWQAPGVEVVARTRESTYGNVVTALSVRAYGCTIHVLDQGPGVYQGAPEYKNIFQLGVLKALSASVTQLRFLQCCLARAILEV